MKKFNCDQDCFHCKYDDCLWKEGDIGNELQYVKVTTNMKRIPMIAKCKRCMYCGKEYDVDSPSHYCSCNEHGFLYTIIE